MRCIILLFGLLLMACASQVETTEEGAHIVTGKGPGYPLAHSELTSRAAELCPDGYDISNERTSWGWVITVSGRVTCR